MERSKKSFFAKLLQYGTFYGIILIVYLYRFEKGGVFVSKKQLASLQGRVDTKKLVPLFCVLLIAVGFLFRLYYNYLTPYDVSAHDLGYAVGLHESKLGSGHLGYIEHICRTGALPDFDPSTRWAFYNPPLFHICASILLGLFHAPGAGVDTGAWEIVQLLPAFAILFATIGTYRLLRTLHLEGIPLLLCVSIVSFHPSLSYLSLTLNNDAMAFALTVWAMYFAVRWFEEPRMRTILCLAACIGLGMMTKLSVALVAPPVALLFAVRFFKDRKWGFYIGQFAAFLGVCVPTGLFWGIRNLVRFDLPITYVQALPENSAQNISGFSTWERFGLPEASDFLRVNSSWSRPNPDHNLWSQTLRTSLFDDNMLLWESVDETWGSALMVLSLALGIFISVLFVWGMLRHKETCAWIRAFFAFFGAILLGYFVKFCIDFPMTCTVHFRYLLPLLPLGAVGIGFWWASTKKGVLARITLGVLGGMLLTSCVLSTVLYVLCLPVAA